MDLAWIRYRSRKGENYALFLILGDRGDKVALLKSTALDAGEQVYIRRHLSKLSSLSLDGRLKWLKQHCPRSLRSAFRYIARRNIHVIKRFTPKQMGLIA